MLAMSKSLLSPPLPATFPRKTHLLHKPQPLSFQPRRGSSLFIARSGSNEAGVATVAVESKIDERAEASDVAVKVDSLTSNGAVALEAVSVEEKVLKFKDTKWVGGAWDLNQFVKDGKIDWDSVIVAEAKRRKWLEDNPETTNNDDPVLFSTSVIPWWAWIKRYHLGEAELLNGRAAMIGFFMAYIVDSLTGVGIVGQTGNFFCKTLLFIAVAGVLLIRNNEDIEKLKKLFEETTFYDKQWQATWQDENTGDSNKK